ncbi:hypothetical protein V492_06855 [Pseudogymnoascus sp. VKM F-4246]|nr:hypothetical protein V492_06855 [Pseudogymnoascus sp. VKM F-4246]
MPPKDTLLSLDMGTDDCLYRLRRDLPSTSTVIYIYLLTLSLLPTDSLTYGRNLIRDLRRTVPDWDEEWTTLTISREDDAVKVLRDEWAPHFLPASAITRELPRINVLGVEVLKSLKNRVSRVRLPDKQQQQRILKIRPFAYQLRYLAQEMRAYEMLWEKGCELVPGVGAYVSERSEEQVIGFLCEEIEGRFAGWGDYEKCREALGKLHGYGVVHGDLNRYNIIMAGERMRFVDLEKAVLDIDVEGEEFMRLCVEELEGLEKALGDEEGWGKPWGE